MTSRKPASGKQAAPPRACDYTKAFLKDWERLSHSGRFDLTRLKQAMLLLIAHDAPLGPEWLDHSLSSRRRAAPRRLDPHGGRAGRSPALGALIGDWADHRECRIGGDFLLIYRLEGNAIVFVRAGTHSGLFEE